MPPYYGLLPGANAVVDKINNADTTKTSTLTSFNTALTAYSTARTALTTKTQQYFAQSGGGAQVNSNKYIMPDAAPPLPDTLLTTDMGCYSLDNLLGLTPQLDMGVANDINACKLRAYDLGYTSFLLDGSGGCLVGSKVGTSTTPSNTTHVVSYPFPTLAGATTARILPNGRLAVYNKTLDPSWNTVTQYPDPATPVHNSVSMCNKGVDTSINCTGFTLTLGDDGTLTMKRLNTDSNSTIIWQTPPLGDVGIKNPLYAAGTGKTTTNILTSLQVLEDTEFIGSPTGTCYLYMNKTATATSGGLELRYRKTPPCTTVPVGSATLYNFTKETVGRNKMLGQIGYVDKTGTIHAYPPEMTTYPTVPTYKLVGGYNITNTPIGSSSAATTDAACAAACTANAACAGYVFSPTPVNVRYVLIKNLPGQANAIQISQLLVFNGTVNLTRQANNPIGSTTFYTPTVTASSPQVQADLPLTAGNKDYAIDGIISNRAYPNIYHSLPNTDAFWQLDLGAEFPVTTIEYYNRAGVLSSRATKMKMVLMNSAKDPLKSFTFTGDAVQIFTVAEASPCRLFTAENMYPIATRTPSDNYKLYVKKRILDGAKIDSTCVNYLTTELGSGLAAPYTTGVPMTADAPCGLPGFTRTEQAALLAADTEVDTAKLGLSNLTGMRDTLRSKLDEAANKIKGTLAKITAALSSKGLIGGSAVTIGGKLEDAELNMRSNQYKNWLWALLALVAVLMCWWLQSTPAAVN